MNLLLWTYASCFLSGLGTSTDLCNPQLDTYQKNRFWAIMLNLKQSLMGHNLTQCFVAAVLDLAAPCSG